MIHPSSLTGETDAGASAATTLMTSLLTSLLGLALIVAPTVAGAMPSVSSAVGRAPMLLLTDRPRDIVVAIPRARLETLATTTLVTRTAWSERPHRWLGVPLAELARLAHERPTAPVTGGDGFGFDPSHGDAGRNDMGPNGACRSDDLGHGTSVLGAIHDIDGRPGGATVVVRTADGSSHGFPLDAAIGAGAFVAVRRAGDRPGAAAGDDAAGDRWTPALIFPWPQDDRRKAVLVRQMSVRELLEIEFE